MASKNWVRVVANMALGGYEVYTASGELADPVWPICHSKNCCASRSRAATSRTTRIPFCAVCAGRRSDAHTPPLPHNLGVDFEFLGGGAW